MRDLILALLLLSAAVWVFSGMPCGFPDGPDTGMYLAGPGGAMTHPGEGSGEAAPTEGAGPPEAEATTPPEPKPSDTPSDKQAQTSDAKPRKSIEELAQEVIRGLWGNGSERKRRLTAAGYDYHAVQQRVNEILQ